MNNGQIATLLQNLLMIGGSAAVATGKVSATDAQTVVGGVVTLVGFFWNHWHTAAMASGIVPNSTGAK